MGETPKICPLLGRKSFSQLPDFPPTAALNCYFPLENKYLQGFHIRGGHMEDMGRIRHPGVTRE